MSTLETLLVDDSIALRQRVSSLLDLLNLYHSDASDASPELTSKILKPLARGLQAEIVCIYLQEKSGEIVDFSFGTKNENLEEDTFLKNVSLKPEIYDEELRTHGFYEQTLIGGPSAINYCLILPVYGDQRDKGYLAILRPYEFEQIDIRIAQQFAQFLAKGHHGKKSGEYQELQYQMVDQIIKLQDYNRVTLEISSLVAIPHITRVDIQKRVDHLGQVLNAGIMITEIGRGINPYFYNLSSKEGHKYLYGFSHLINERELVFIDEGKTFQVWGVITHKGKTLGYAGAIRNDGREFSQFEGSYFVGMCQIIGLGLSTFWSR